MRLLEAGGTDTGIGRYSPHPPAHGLSRRTSDPGGADRDARGGALLAATWQGIRVSSF